MKKKGKHTEDTGDNQRQDYKQINERNFKSKSTDIYYDNAACQTHRPVNILGPRKYRYYRNSDHRHLTSEHINGHPPIDYEDPPPDYDDVGHKGGRYEMHHYNRRVMYEESFSCLKGQNIVHKEGRGRKDKAFFLPTVDYN